MELDPLYSIKETARLLGGVSISLVERMLQKGEMRRIKIGRRTMIRATELQKVMREDLDNVRNGANL